MHLYFVEGDAQGSVVVAAVAVREDRRDVVEELRSLCRFAQLRQHGAQGGLAGHALGADGIAQAIRMALDDVLVEVRCSPGMHY